MVNTDDTRNKHKWPTPRYIGEPSPPVRRRVRRLLWIFPMLLFALAVSFLPFFQPSSDDPQRADAVFVLSGDHGERLRAALGLVGRGVAPILVFDGIPDNQGEDEYCAGKRPPYQAICLQPRPDSTRNEARAGAALAEERGWDHIVVVTSLNHVTRARLLFSRCFDGQVSVIGQRPPYDRWTNLHQIRHEWLAVAHALTLGRGC